MGNSKYYQFLFSKIPMLTLIEGKATIGAAGAVSATSGNSVSSITKLATGIYQIQLTENYNAHIGSHFTLEAPATGGAVTDGAFVTGTLYQIQTLGTTNWASVGLNAGLTPTVGQSFVATGAGGAGGGTVKALGSTGVFSVEVQPNPSGMLTTSTKGLGGIIIVQLKDATGTLVAPATGSALRFNLMLRNSSNQF